MVLKESNNNEKSANRNKLPIIENMNETDEDNKIISFDDLEKEILCLEYPEIELETDDIKLILTLKKDYSKIEDLKNRKEEFIKDMKDFIDEFVSNKEFDELMEYY